MTPEEKLQLERLEQKLDTFLDLYYRTNMLDKTVYPNKVYFNGGIFFKDGTVISSGGTLGMKIGSATTEKIGFLGAVPISRQSAISAPSGGATVDSQSRTAINSIITTLQNYGFIA